MRNLFVTLAFLLTGMTCISQELSGTWKGVVSLGPQKLTIVFHISKQGNDIYTATMDSPDQGAFGIRCERVVVTKDSISLYLDDTKGFTGRLDDATHINGVLFQGPAKFPVVLTRGDGSEPVKAPVVKKPKPQTPVGPFDYPSEEVIYNNNISHTQLGATFTKPKNGTRFPVILFITGSGPQDRDYSLGDHKAYLYMADYFAKQGIATLRVDDRGVGKSTGNFMSSTTADFATDVMAGIDYLKTRSDVDTTKIGLVGHSEGGIIAPYVAARRKDLRFIVMLAGPVVGGKQTMIYQAVDKPLASVSQHDRDANKEIYTKMNIDIALSDEIQKDIPTYVRTTYLDWKSRQPDSTLQLLVRGTDEQVIASFISASNDTKRPWWRVFLSYDWSKDLQQVKIPVLALNGEKDEQVDPKANLALINSILAKNGNKHFTVYEVPGVNHLFQHCQACGSVREYLALDETFDVGTMEMIGGWVKGVVK